MRRKMEARNRPLSTPCPSLPNEILGPQVVSYVGDLFCGAIPRPILLFVL